MLDGIGRIKLGRPIEMYVSILCEQLSFLKFESTKLIKTVTILMYVTLIYFQFSFLFWPVGFC